jgi:hypothetical protein
MTAYHGDACELPLRDSNIVMSWAFRVMQLADENQ